MEPQGHLLEGLTFSEECGQANGRAVAETVPELRVPRVDEELNLQAVGQVQVESATMTRGCYTSCSIQYNNKQNKFLSDRHRHAA